MKRRPVITVIVLLILLMALLAATVVVVVAFPMLRNFWDMMYSGSSTEPPSLQNPTTASATAPTESVRPTTIPTEPTTEPTEPATEPTEPPTQPTEPETLPPTEPSQPETQPRPCAHSYEAVATEATCVEPGFTTYTCNLCGDTYVDDYTALTDHSYGQWSVEKEPTCTAEGREICACTYCGEKQSRTVEAKGHSYGSWEIMKNPTCTEEGTKQRACKRCSHTQEKSIDPTGHAYDDGVVTKQASSCADTGIKRYTCKNCGDAYEATVFGDHDLACNTCSYYGTGNCDGLHEPGVQCDMEHEVGCKNCDFGYMDKAYFYLCAGIIDESSAMFTDTVKLKNPNYNGVLGTWSERWHEFATFTQMGIMYGSWSAKDGWEGQDYEYRVWDITSYEQAQAVLDEYNEFVVEFEKVYYWKPVEVKMEYREDKQYVRLYYTDQDQYNAYRQCKKKVTDAQKETLANEVIGYTLQKWGIHDGMKVANILEYLYYKIWEDVAYYDQSLRFHSAYDGFATHTCVCDGYSEMFLLYADALGINAEEVTGRLNGVGHAWNRVIFSDGSKWHVDITNGPVLETSDRMREFNYTWKGD